MNISDKEKKDAIQKRTDAIKICKILLSLKEKILNETSELNRTTQQQKSLDLYEHDLYMIRDYYDIKTNELN